MLLPEYCENIQYSGNNICLDGVISSSGFSIYHNFSGNNIYLGIPSA